MTSPGFLDRLYGSLGFRAARAPRPEAVAKGDHFHTSFIRFPLRLADRLRILWGGNVAVEVLFVTDRPFLYVRSTADLAVLPPNLAGPDNEQ